jgi:hypothetical protein
MLLPLMLMVARMTLVLLLLWLHTVPFARQGHPRCFLSWAERLLGLHAFSLALSGLADGGAAKLKSPARSMRRPEAAGITAGAWYAWPSTHIGHELIAAGMLVLAGGGRGLPLDYDELERWARVGHERGMRSPMGER